MDNAATMPGYWRTARNGLWTTGPPNGVTTAICEVDSRNAPTMMYKSVPIYSDNAVARRVGFVGVRSGTGAAPTGLRSAANIKAIIDQGNSNVKGFCYSHHANLASASGTCNQRVCATHHSLLGCGSSLDTGLTKCASSVTGQLIAIGQHFSVRFPVLDGGVMWRFFININYAYGYAIYLDGQLAPANSVVDRCGITGTAHHGNTCGSATAIRQCGNGRNNNGDGSCRLAAAAQYNTDGSVQITTPRYSNSRRDRGYHTLDVYVVEGTVERCSTPCDASQGGSACPPVWSGKWQFKRVTCPSTGSCIPAVNADGTPPMPLRMEAIYKSLVSNDNLYCPARVTTHGDHLPRTRAGRVVQTTCPSGYIGTRQTRCIPGRNSRAQSTWSGTVNNCRFGCTAHSQCSRGQYCVSCSSCIQTFLRTHRAGSYSPSQLRDVCGACVANIGRGRRIRGDCASNRNMACRMQNDGIGGTCPASTLDCHGNLSCGVFFRQHNIPITANILRNVRCNVRGTPGFMCCNQNNPRSGCTSAPCWFIATGSCPTSQRNPGSTANRRTCPASGGFPRTSVGAIGSKTCGTGYTGSIRKMCQRNGRWASQITENCSRGGYCPGTGIWRPARPGQTQSQPCPGTWAVPRSCYQGTATRTCRSAGRWAAPRYQCRMLCCAAQSGFRAVRPGFISAGRCPPGFSGSRRRRCLAGRRWEAAQNIQSNCQQNTGGGNVKIQVTLGVGMSVFYPNQRSFIQAFAATGDGVHSVDSSMIFMDRIIRAGSTQVTLLYVVSQAHLADVTRTTSTNSFQQTLRANLARYVRRDVPILRVTAQGWHRGQCMADKQNGLWRARNLQCDEEGWYSKLQCNRNQTNVATATCWCTDRHTGTDHTHVQSANRPPDCGIQCRPGEILCTAAASIRSKGCACTVGRCVTSSPDCDPNYLQNSGANGAAMTFGSANQNSGGMGGGWIFLIIMMVFGVFGGGAYLVYFHRLLGEDGGHYERHDGDGDQKVSMGQMKSSIGSANEDTNEVTGGSPGYAPMSDDLQRKDSDYTPPTSLADTASRETVVDDDDDGQIDRL